MVNVFVAFAPDAGVVKILVAPATVNVLDIVVAPVRVVVPATVNPLAFNISPANVGVSDVVVESVSTAPDVGIDNDVFPDNANVHPYVFPPVVEVENAPHVFISPLIVMVFSLNMPVPP